jgi:hypothetical protein
MSYELDFGLESIIDTRVGFAVVEYRLPAILVALRNNKSNACFE